MKKLCCGLPESGNDDENRISHGLKNDKKSRDFTKNEFLS